VGLLSGSLLGQMFERRRLFVQTQRDERLATKLEQLLARLERSVP
jgi:hypothetical protein